MCIMYMRISMHSNYLYVLLFHVHKFVCICMCIHQHNIIRIYVWDVTKTWNGTINGTIHGVTRCITWLFTGARIAHETFQQRTNSLRYNTRFKVAMHLHTCIMLCRLLCICSNRSKIGS